MATNTWRTANGSGLWSVASNWFTLSTPEVADSVLLPAATPYAATVDVPFIVASVTLGGAGATLDIASALTATAGVAVAASAEVDLAGTLAGGTLDLTEGGTLLGDGGTLEASAVLGEFSTIGGGGLLINAGSIGWNGIGPGAIGIAGLAFQNTGQFVLAPVIQSETNEFVTSVMSGGVHPTPSYSELSWLQSVVANVAVSAASFANGGDIEVDGGTLSIASATFDNSGSITLLGLDTQTVEPVGTTDGIVFYDTADTTLLTQVTVGAGVATFENTGTITAGSVVFEQPMTLADLGTINAGLTFDAGLDLGGGALDQATMSAGGLVQDGSLGGTGTLSLQAGATLDNVAIGTGVLVVEPAGGTVTVVDPRSTGAAVTLDAVINELDFRTASSFDGHIVLGPGASNDVIGVFTPGGVTLGPGFSLTDSRAGSVLTFGGGTLLNDGTWTLDGGSIEVGATLGGTGAIELNNSATVQIAALATSAAPAVAFGAGNSTLILPGTGAIGAVLSGLAVGDSVDFASVSSTPKTEFATGAAAAEGSTLDLQAASGEHASVSLGSAASGLSFTVVPDGNGGSLVEVACFAAGSRIATGAGAVPVEHLRPGDLVRTLAGRLAPVRWVGWTQVDLARHPVPARAAPVRIRADAFAPGQPARDLLVSPEHCLFVDGCLIPAFALLNGATIARDDGFSTIAYWHVELDRHDILLAEGLPTESYLDTGNRGRFAGEAGVRALHLDLTAAPDAAAQWVWEAHGCAPLLLVAAGPRAALRARAEALGWRLGEDAGIAVSADGLPVPCRRGPNGLAARLPPGARRVRLRSRSFVPAEQDPGSGDMRRLGVAVAAVCLGGWKLPAEALDSGWHVAAAAEAWRWTDGDAGIAVPRQSRPGVLELRLPRLGRFWQSPRPHAAMADPANQIRIRV